MVSIALQNTTRLIQKWRDKTEVTVQGIRVSIDTLAASIKLPKDVKCEAVNAGGVPAEWISTPGINLNNVIIHYHGGGFLAGSVKNSREYLGRVSRATKTQILSVDYRLAPAHPFSPT